MQEIVAMLEGAARSARQERPLRVLHVLGGMARGGAETWLMHVLRRTCRDCLQMDFLVHTDEPQAYDEEVRALGSSIYPCLHPRRPWQYARNFKRILARHGPYDVVHSHVHHYSGYTLRLAHQSGVPVRIAHSHNEVLLPGQKRLVREGYLRWMKAWIRRHATVGLAASGKAAADLFGVNWRADPRWQILYCAIDPAPFGQPANSAAVRKELGIPAGAWVVGHVGRFSYQKNHAFLLEIMAELVRRDPTAWLLLVGEGPLRKEIEEKARRAGLGPRVIFAGSRGDVPRLMTAAMDLFLFPSHFEGLPLVLLESQAAGLPCLASDAITEEIAVVQPLMRRLSLDRPASVWAEEVLALRRDAETLDPGRARTLVEQSDFNICTSLAHLTRVYAVSESCPHR